MKKILILIYAMFILSSGLAISAEDGGLEIGLDYRFRLDSLKGNVHEYFDVNTMAGQAGYTVKNETIFMNRFGITMKANPVEDVMMKARILMYKVAGHQTANPALGSFFADRFAQSGTNDGTVGHVPQDSVLRVDYAYVTVDDIFNAPAWFSIGRRPSTGGLPSNYRQNNLKMGTAGIPSLLVNYAFDGMTLGYAPDLEALPGSYVKLCYGRGFDSGFQQEGGLKDTDFWGLNTALYDSENFHVELQYQKGMNIFDAPSDTAVAANLGDIRWTGGVVTGRLGSVDIFVSGAMSKTDPSGQAAGGGSVTASSVSLLNNGTDTESRTGSAVYVGSRFNMATGTRIGIEYNHGSNNWISMVPAEDDIWTGKLGTRGDVYEIYLIQSLNKKAIARKGEAFVRLGYQLYKFEYTGSNNWVGAPSKIADLTQSAASAPQMMPPLKKASDIYLTFDVRF